MTKEAKKSKKQEAILAAFGQLAAATAVVGDPTDYTPSQVGVACGKDKGSPAADWAYPAIKTLLRKGLLAKGSRPGRYTLAPAEAAA